METKEKSHVFQTLLYAIAWFISSLLAVVDLLNLRETVLDVLTSIQFGIQQNDLQNAQEFGKTIQAIDQGLLFLGGTVAVALAVFFEYYFRKGEEKGKLVKRIVWVISIEVAIYLVLLLIQVIV